jgi:hypothetical protein
LVTARRRGGVALSQVSALEEEREVVRIAPEDPEGAILVEPIALVSVPLARLRGTSDRGFPGRPEVRARALGDLQGTRVVFTSDGDGSDDIYIADADGSI